MMDELWQREASRDLVETLHLLACNQFDTPTELAGRLEVIASTIRQDYGGVLGRDDQLLQTVENMTYNNCN